MNSDLEYFNKQVVRLYNHTNEAILLQENVTHITQDTLKSISNDFEIFNRNILKIENWSNSIDTKINQLTAENLLSEAIIKLEIAIDDYKDYIKTYINGIIHAQTRHISPSLIPPSVVIKSLNNLQEIDPFIIPTFKINKSNLFI